MTHELATLFDDLTADVHEVDLTARAWRGAQEQRARRRRNAVVATAATAAVAVAVFVPWVGGRDGATAPSGSTPSASTATATTLPSGPWQLAPDGTQYVIGPAQGAEGTLRPVDIGLPPEIDTTGPRQRLADLVAAGRPPTVVAVLLEATDQPAWEDATKYRPLLVDSAGAVIEVDLTLGQVNDGQGNYAAPLGVGAVSPDATLVAFPQTTGLVVLDVTKDRVVRAALESRILERVHWRDRDSAVVSGTDGTWQVDIVGLPGRVTGLIRVGEIERGYIGTTHRLKNPPGPGGTLITFDPDLKASERAVLAPVDDPGGETFSGGGVVASGVFMFDWSIMVGSQSGYQGVLTLPVGDPGGHRLLVIPPDGYSKGCCPVLGLTSDGDAIFRSSGPVVHTLLTFDSGTGEVRRAGAVRYGLGVGAIALGVGERR